MEQTRVRVDLFVGADQQWYVELERQPDGWRLPRFSLFDVPEGASEQWFRVGNTICGVRARVVANTSVDMPLFLLDELPDLSTMDARLLGQGIRRLGQYRRRQLVCAIVGCKSSSSRFTPQVADQAFQAGLLASSLGFAVLTGGLSGVMSAAAAGARSGDGHTVGILPGDKHDDANPHMSLVLPSGLGYARNYLTALGCDVMIALPGGNGTLEEMLFALDFDRLVISWGGPTLDGAEQVKGGDEVKLKVRLMRYLAGVHGRQT